MTLSYNPVDMTETPVPIPRPTHFTVAADLVAATFRRVLQWIPPKARLAVCLGSLALTGLAIYTYRSSDSGSLSLICRHSLRTAELSVFVDGSQTFSDQISGTVKKRFGILDKRVEGTLSKTLTVSLGEHIVRVRLKSSPEQFDQTKQIVVNLVSGKEATVVITAQRGELSLAYQGPAVVPVKDSGPAYSGSLWSILVTVMGSAMSAAIGFVVQEFLRTRKAASSENRNSKPVS